MQGRLNLQLLTSGPACALISTIFLMSVQSKVCSVRAPLHFLGSGGCFCVHCCLACNSVNLGFLNLCTKTAFSRVAGCHGFCAL